MSAGLHFRNLILDTKCCRITAPILDQRPNVLNNRISSRRTEIISWQGRVYMTVLLETIDGGDSRQNEEKTGRQQDEKVSQGDVGKQHHLTKGGGELGCL